MLVVGVAALLFFLERRSRLTHSQIISRCVVIRKQSTVILAVGTDTVEQIAVLLGLVNQRLTGEEIAREESRS